MEAKLETTVHQEKKKDKERASDDKHHCCGRFIKTNADRKHHNDIYHKKSLSENDYAIFYARWGVR